MKTNTISSLILVLFLVGCSSTARPVFVPTQSEPMSTLTPVPTNTPQSTETLKPLPTQTPSPLAEPTQTPSCYQSAMAQLEINQCASQEYQAAHAKLDALIIELKPHMNSSQYEALLKIEADWENMTGEQCQWQASFFEGSSV